MIQTYREQLTDDVWTGKHESIWPGTEDDGLKYAAWRKVMLSLRHDFEDVLAQLEETMKRNTQEQKDISALQMQVRRPIDYGVTENSSLPSTNHGPANERERCPSCSLKRAPRPKTLRF
jgi:hypothetical protein